MAMKMLMPVFRMVTPCGLVGRYQYFGGTYGLHKTYTFIRCYNLEDQQRHNMGECCPPFTIYKQQHNTYKTVITQEYNSSLVPYIHLIYIHVLFILKLNQ
jgi:hypothetical protein